MSRVEELKAEIEALEREQKELFLAACGGQKFEKLAKLARTFGQRTVSSHDGLMTSVYYFTAKYDDGDMFEIIAPALSGTHNLEVRLSGEAIASKKEELYIPHLVQPILDKFMPMIEEQEEKNTIIVLENELRMLKDKLWKED